jgi:CRP/FNR family cyclic AMP-dependent transcriptional regulator
MRRVLYIFGLFSDEDMNWLADTGRTERILSGQRIVAAGRPMDTLFFVLDGSFIVTVDGRRDPIAVLTDGDVVGEISLLDSRPPAANVTAATNATVLSLKRRDLISKLEFDLGFSSRFYRALATFLAQRLRVTVATFGCSGDVENSLDVSEIDPDLLDTVSIAGVRFVWLKERLAVSVAEASQN